jgi:pyruvate formate lyase activating enzyme
MSVKGIVFNIQRFSVNDGPGIRTIVFLKGCPLRCFWCSNPESQKSSFEISYIHKICLLCQRCVQTCPNEALKLIGDNIDMDYAKCKVCGKCVEVCPVNARKIEGEEYTVEKLFEVVAKDLVFFKTSKGGVTISGGEPYTQFEFLLSFLKKCKQETVHTAVETCGYAEWDKIELTLKYIDLFLYDLKHMDTALHEEYTGVQNKRILENFNRLVAKNVNIVVRFPLIPDYNNDNKNLERMVEFLEEVNYSDEIHILPYHRLGSNKYQHLDKEYKLEELKPPKDKEIIKVERFFKGKGYTVKLFG